MAESGPTSWVTSMPMRSSSATSSGPAIGTRASEAGSAGFGSNAGERGVEADRARPAVRAARLDDETLPALGPQVDPLVRADRGRGSDGLATAEGRELPVAARPALEAVR